MQRALQTCLLSFAPCVKRGLRVLATPLAQECTDETSDVGSAPDDVRKLFGEDQVDLSLVEEGWNSKEGEYATEPSIVMARAAKLRRWLRSRKEQEIVLVSHGRFAHFLTGHVNEKGEQTTGWWQDAELRSFTFVNESNDQIDDDAMIQETKESRDRRAESGKASKDAQSETSQSAVYMIIAIVLCICIWTTSQGRGTGSR